MCRDYTDQHWRATFEHCLSSTLFTKDDGRLDYALDPYVLEQFIRITDSMMAADADADWHRWGRISYVKRPRVQECMRHQFDMWRNIDVLQEAGGHVYVVKIEAAFEIGNEMISGIRPRKANVLPNHAADKVIACAQQQQKSGRQSL